ncbi:MAG: 26S protease regulatory subunit [Clostridia bacterium]|jgi:ATP-dependent 26S proteasome regulatory subunit|nr:26S protease regulatory subunit [Clostridia bacterium]
MAEIKVIFYKSSSRFYQEICQLCEEEFENYIHDNSSDVLKLSYSELQENLIVFKRLFETTKRWKKTEYYLNNIEILKSEIDCIFEVMECNQRFEIQTIDNEYCYENCGWGCSLLRSIQLRNEYSYGYYRPDFSWYDFGSFIDDRWVINHKLITETLNEEVDKKHINLCSNFDFARIQTIINDLPEFVVVDDGGSWKYKYRSAPVGMTQTEIIGIEPKKEDNRFSQGLSINTMISDGIDDTEDKSQKYIPDVTFEDVGGIDNIVQEVREVIELPIIANNIFEHYHIKPHKGILLYGPPGCGKTLIAKAIANEINAHFVTVNGPEIINKFLGQSEANLRAIFEEAKKLTPSIIYFDEFDSISARRDAEHNPLNTTIVNQLLTLMDGIGTTEGICVIASTNRIDIIDEAIKRPGRFDYKIEVEKPTLEGRKKIFHIHTDKMPVDTAFNKDDFVEKNLTGLSGADIAFVAAEAAYNSIRRTIDMDVIFQSNDDILMTVDNIIVDLDFQKAIKKLKTSITRSESAKYRY